MAKKNLAEAAAEILGTNIATKRAEGEKFGAGKEKTVNTPGQSDDVEDMGGPINPTNAGVDKAVSGAPGNSTSNYPGKTPPVGKEPMKHLGDDGRVGANASGIAEEDETNEEEISENKETDDSDDKKEMKENELMPDTKGETSDIDSVEPVSSKIKSYFKDKTHINVAEDVDAIFSGENLSETFKKKVTAIFETAVLSKTIEVATKLCEEFQKEKDVEMEVAVSTMVESLTKKVDGYLNYMVEEWVTENEVAIEKGLKAELSEELVEDLINVLLEHNIDLPKDKVNIAEELAEKVEELEKKLTEELNRGVELNKKLNEHKKDEALRVVCEGLTDTQIQKIKTLAENVNFTTEEEFKTNVKTLRESYFPVKVSSNNDKKVENTLNEFVEIEEEKTNTEMDVFARAISKSLK